MRVENIRLLLEVWVVAMGSAWREVEVVGTIFLTSRRRIKHDQTTATSGLAEAAEGANGSVEHRVT